MYKLVVGMLAILSALFIAQPVYADTSDIVIYQVQAGASSGSGAATQEIVTIYNNSSLSVEISNWCLKSNSGEIGCFKPEVPNETIYLNAKSHALIASASYLTVHPESLDPYVNYDVIYPVKNATSGSIVSSSDTVRILDSQSNEKDAISWTTSLSGGQVLTRKNGTDNLLLDTDSSSDFLKTTVFTIPASGVVFMRSVVDICPTVDGTQEQMPEGYGYDNYGNCEALTTDLCANIPLIQVEYPNGMLADDQRNCFQDTCENISGLQIVIPDRHSAEDKNCIEIEHRNIEITEVLANVAGYDTGREFIELYNPNNEPIMLSGYVLQIGKTFEEDFFLKNFTTVTKLEANSYLAIYDYQLGFSLLNTNSSIRVRAPAGNIVSEVHYIDPPNDQSWSLLDGEWKYTNQPTPGFTNQSSFIEEMELPSSTKKPLGVNTKVSMSTCIAGKYRHPITNRCRNIENDTVMLAACDNDEYRNPETNRCRKTATLAATLAACSEGSERNPETNRCRKAEVTTTALAACQNGYVRNPETNRCRKAMLDGTGSMNGSVEMIKENASNSVSNAFILTAGLSAVGYGLYEWRSEFSRGIRRIYHFVSGK